MTADEFNKRLDRVLDVDLRYVFRGNILTKLFDFLEQLKSDGDIVAFDMEVVMRSFAADDTYSTIQLMVMLADTAVLTRRRIDNNEEWCKVVKIY